MPDYELKPWPLTEYPSRLVEYRSVGDKFRGVIGCSRMDGSLRKAVYFDFWCELLRDDRAEALADARYLFYRLETYPPTVAFSGLLYSLPSDQEHARAARWLQDNPPSPDEFEAEFPGARLVNHTPLGLSATTAG